MRRVRAADLLQGSQRVLLEHLGHAYVLIVTKKGGLLLNRVS
ncbi:MAG: hemin uptake protein HemP [Planctomycetes bacterium]|nr:hemin uptake protein HemP [Planctomycetota bacterium]